MIQKLLLLLIVTTITLGSCPIAKPVLASQEMIPRADVLPAASSQFYYIDDTWGIYVNFQGGPRLIAYQMGWNAPVGDPNPTLILDFGRQGYYYDSNRNENVWGNWLLNGGPFKETSTWVRIVVENFMQGYSDNPAHGAVATIAAGTSNSNYPWTCNGPEWNFAGQVWGILLQSLFNGGTLPSKVIKKVPMIWNRGQVNQDLMDGLHAEMLPCVGLIIMQVSAVLAISTSAAKRQQKAVRGLKNTFGNSHGEDFRPMLTQRSIVARTPVNG